VASQPATAARSSSSEAIFFQTQFWLPNLRLQRNEENLITSSWMRSLLLQRALVVTTLPRQPVPFCHPTPVLDRNFLKAYFTVCSLPELLIKHVKRFPTIGIHNDLVVLNSSVNGNRKKLSQNILTAFSCFYQRWPFLFLPRSSSYSSLT
jgi:hypothetical protein